MKNKDKALTYEELTALCRKQEERIKELEKKFKPPSVAKPSYEELLISDERLWAMYLDRENTINALLYSLGKANDERLKNESEIRYYKGLFGKEKERANELERARANDLLEKLEEKENEN